MFCIIFMLTKPIDFRIKYIIYDKSKYGLYLKKGKQTISLKNDITFESAKKYFKK